MQEDLNKQFINTSDAGDEVFGYLGDVRETDHIPGEDDQIYKDTAEQEDINDYDDSDKARMPGNYRSNNLTSRIEHISSEKPAYAGHRDLGNVTIMPKPMQRKTANTVSAANTVNTIGTRPQQSGGFLARLGRVTLHDIEKFRRKVFFNSPIVESAVLGGIAGLGTYALAPTFNRFLGEKPKINKKTGELEYIDPEDRKSVAKWVGLGLAGVNLLRGVHFSSDFNINQFFRMPKIASLKKRASMLGPIDYVPTQFALNAVTLDPNIPDNLKYNTLQALGTIDKPMINSTDMVSAGINSGISGSTGIPVGRIAAASVADAVTAYGVGSLFGSDNPGKFARNVGALSALGRVLYHSFNQN